MRCQICGRYSGYYPLCKECNRLKEEGKVTKCDECGIWKEGNKPLCLDCYWKMKRASEKKSANYRSSEIENEENNFRNAFPAQYRADDGHFVRSKAEQIIDNWLYHKSISHAYERRLPIEEEVYCDFFIPTGKVWIEYWGLEDDKYLNRKEIKKSTYEKYNMKLVEITDKDIENFDDIMPLKLKSHFPKSFSFD
jgi:hypothetical protein